MVRRWVPKFGPLIARKLRRRRPRPRDRWHLDEMVARIAGKRMYLWRAVNHEGEILDMRVQRRRDSRSRIADHPVKRVAELLPCNWQPGNSSASPPEPAGTSRITIAEPRRGSHRCAHASLAYPRRALTVMV
jgi:hypothetical protein